MKRDKKAKEEKVELDWDVDHDEKKPGTSEFLKKIMSTVLSSSPVSEEQIKAILSNLNLSKDVSREMVSQTLKALHKSKEDILHRIGSEIAKIIEKIDLVKELKDSLSHYKISIHSEIEFIPKDQTKNTTKRKKKNISLTLSPVKRKKIKTK